MQLDKNQKLKVAKAICDLYSTNKYTIESCCESEGVLYRTFNTWISEGQRGYVAEISELYKKALETKADNNRKELKELALTAFQRLLKGEETEEEKTTSIVGESGEQNVVKVEKTKKTIMPNPAAVIFGLKNLDSEHFKDKQDIDFNNILPEQPIVLDITISDFEEKTNESDDGKEDE